MTRSLRLSERGAAPAAAEGPTRPAEGTPRAPRASHGPPTWTCLGALDLSSEQGQRNAITAILAKGECILAIRILLHPNHKSSDAASSRNATCIAINGLRPQLHSYFNYVLRVDTSGPVSVLPSYMLHYSFATATGREEADTLIAQLLRFEFDHMNFFGAPHGAGTWAQHVSASTAAETVATINRFIQPSNIERIKNFVAILLGSLGLPQSLPIAQGYTWEPGRPLWIFTPLHVSSS